MNRFYILVFFLSVLIGACNSPMDVDTTRNTKKLYGRVKIYPLIIDMSFDENGMSKNYIATSPYIVVDTNLEVPAIWFHLNLKAGEGLYTDFNRMNVESIEINADSLPVNNSPFVIADLNLKNSWTKYILNRGVSTKFDTTLMSDPNLNISEISFSLNKEKRELWSYLYSKIYNNRIWSTYRDTLVRDTIIESYIDTVWRDGQMELEEKKRKVIQERTEQIEEIQRAPDSLFLRAKIRMQY